MTTSTMLEAMRGASKETMTKIVHEDGRQTLYFTDHRGREFYSLISKSGSFQGTYPITRLKPKAERPVDNYISVRNIGIHLTRS
jgi:hypothetical protein